MNSRKEERIGKKKRRDERKEGKRRKKQIGHIGESKRRIDQIKPGRIEE